MVETTFAACRSLTPLPAGGTVPNENRWLHRRTVRPLHLDRIVRDRVAAPIGHIGKLEIDLAAYKEPTAPRSLLAGGPCLVADAP